MHPSSQKTNNIGRKRRMRIVMLFVLCFFVWTGYTFYVQSISLSDKEAELQALLHEKAQAKQTQDELVYKANRLNDKEYIAEIARKNYFMAYPWETLIITPEN